MTRDLRGHQGIPLIPASHEVQDLPEKYNY